MIKRNTRIYRFSYEYYDQGDNAVVTSKGLIVAKSYTEAMEKLVEISSIPGKPDSTNIIGIKFLYEVDSFDGLGIIEDDEIKEALEENEDD